MQTLPPPSPPQKCPHQKVIVNGAQCSESNENVNKFFFRFLFFEISSKIGVILQKKDTGCVLLKDMQTPPLPLRNDPHQKVIANGAQCSESNENMNKKNFRFLFFELSSKIGVIFTEK